MREIEWDCVLDVKEVVLENGSKKSKGVDCQRKQDHVSARI